LAALILAACVSPPESAPTAAKLIAKWYGVYLDDGLKVGSSSVATEPWQGGVRTIDMFEVFSRDTDNRNVRISDRVMRYVDVDGRTTRIERVSSSGATSVRVMIGIRGDVAVAVRKTASDESTVTIALPPAVRFDGGEGLISGWDGAQELAFDTFNSAALTVDRVVMRALSTDPATGVRHVARSTYRGGALSGVSEQTIDAEGQVLETALDLFGARLVVRAASEAEAARASTPASFVTRVMVKSPHRISSQAMRGHIRYVFGFKDGRAFDLPQTPEQRAVKQGDEAVVDICAACGPGLSTDSRFIRAGLQPTPWLQSESGRLREMAAFAPGNTLSDHDKMEVLGRRVRSALTKLTFVGHYSALEAAERGDGDCAEDAVLLTALARAAGIPAYVATGLVYSRERYHGVSNVFMPHNWTMAYVDGKWTSFDVSLGDFDATHIALSVNEGEASAMASAQQLSSHLEWRRMMEVRADPTTAP
jgi:Transglutaminase-like superfamily